MKRILITALILLLSCMMLGSCGSKTDPDEPPVMGDDIKPTDYSVAENWINIPDSDFEVDVFYLYPTSWTKTDADPHYCEIDNETLRKGASFSYLRQATAFETVANVYAPFYRQVDALWLMDNSLEAGQKYIDGIPYTDAVAAFEYYLENYNDGKPFILVGHSQGSSVIKSMLKYYMAEHPDVYEKMVAAYVVGYSVTEQELQDYPHLKFAEGPDDTGVIVAWNTEAPGTDYNPLLFEGTMSINPITWTRTEEPASAEQNLGSLLANAQTGELTEVSNLADATVNLERGSVICSSVDVEVYAPDGGIFPKGSYHINDFQFYYYNIRENAQTRINAFLDPRIPPVMGDEIEPIDYSVADNWLHTPDTDYDVDVFYLYPTAWTRMSEDEPYFCEIDNASMVAGSELMYMAQATAFETVGNVYAPYYRQIDAPWLLNKPLEGQEKYFTGLPYTDAIAAFEYYLENYNDGKPFILAGHSQGSSVTKSIVKYYMAEHPDVYENMVAAYVIGYFVTEQELENNPHMKFAQGADDTGVIVSWNVEAPDMTIVNPLAPAGSVSINPITWTLTEETASADLNLGSEIFNRAEGSLTHMDKFADATINLERGTVVCSTADIEQFSPAGALFPRGVYHAQDYGFYYHNIRENAQTRVDAFLAE